MKARKPFGAAWLPHEKLGRTTLHVFECSEVRTIKRDGASVTGLVHIYRCVETDEFRTWGFDRTTAKDNGGN